MKPIPLNVKPPKNYRREFHLMLPGARHVILVNRKGINLTAHGIDIPAYRNEVLDWIGESIMSVRSELEDL
jgi:hypothetical protein